jgi:hypothetical protein
MARPALAIVLMALVVPATLAQAQSLPKGTVVDDVPCANDPTQRYALYLPSTYSPDRTWSVLMGFHAGGRGRPIVELYQAAAEQYGYIVAASNNSRNGSWDVSAAAVRAMSADLAQRFTIDAERVYLTGHSGGARVAMQVALGSKAIAGVIASSAGFPDAKSRREVGFAVFATAGSDDFNYLEMRELDKRLTTPHRLAIFTGGHQLPPPAVALEAIEWLELIAMKQNRRPKDEAFLTRILTARQQAAAAAGDTPAAVELLEAMVADFAGLRDVSAETARLAALTAEPEIKRARTRQQTDENVEARDLNLYLDLEAGLRDPDRRTATLVRLRDRLSRWAALAAAVEDTPARSRARRLLRAVAAGAMERVNDDDYRALIAEFAPRQRPSGA